MMLLIVCTAYIVTYNLAGERYSVPIISEYPVSLSKGKHVSRKNNSTVLKILTLNIAHGRKDGVNQIFQSKEKIKSNLDEIVLLLKRENPDLAGLQEADGPSVWSGEFSHVAYIAEKSGFSYSVRGEHVKGMMLSYGTALLSRPPLESPLSVTFKPSPPTFSKGFVSSDINLFDESETKIVSVHLGFSRKTIREQQVKGMIEKLSVSKQSLIIMGDFNCELEQGSALQILVKKLRLSAYKADKKSMITFLKLNKRLDYILISQDLEFVSYQVIEDIVSDHLGVISEIRKKI